jgi:2-hydroxymuconate-semialdehyde hydrolase
MTGVAAAGGFERLQSNYVEFEGRRVHCWQGGQGPALLLLHGSGPGASSYGNWAPVLDELARTFTVVAMDLVGFGGSDRKSEQPYFDCALWQRQAAFGLDLCDADSVCVVGHSISAALALRLAAIDERVDRILTTGAMGTLMPVNHHLQKVWRCPPDRVAMRQSAETLIDDSSLISDAYLDARMGVIGSDEYRAYFDAMFSEPFETYIRSVAIPEEMLSAIGNRVLLLHGMRDKAFPAEQCSMVLAPKLANADLWLLSNCSHSVALERPDAFLAAVAALFEDHRRFYART